MRDVVRKRGAFLVVLLLAAWLRFDAAFDDRRFHPDEALYSTFARDAVTFGDWWLSGPLDKPPLSLYASALAMHFTAAGVTPQGVIDVPPLRGEIAARLPNVFAGVVLVAVGWAIASHVSHLPYTPLLVGLLLAVSPFAVGFSASAFTDTLMLALAGASLLAGLRGHGVMAGILLALSIAAKPQGGFFVLPVCVLVFHRRDVLLRCVIAFAAGLALLLLWDLLRPGESFLSVGNRHINPGRPFASPQEWPARLHVWLDYGAELFGPWWLTAGLVGSGIAGVLLRRDALSKWLLLAVVAYTIFHVVAALPVFDRYLLVIVVPAALLIAEVWASLLRTRWRLRSAAVMVLALSLMALHPYDAGQYGRRSGDPVALAGFLNDRSFGAILYDHWLGWELDYYLGAWTDKRRVYYPAPPAFAEDAPRNSETAPRYLVAPVDENVDPWLAAAEQADFRPTPIYEHAGFVVFRLLR